MKLNRKRTQNYLQQFDFESLFIEELGWDTVDPLTLQLEVSEKTFAVEAIAHKRGFTVYQCISEAIPERKIRLQLDGQLTEFSKSHLLIFGDDLQTEQLWMWVKQEQGKKKPVFHLYQVGKGAEPLIQKLEALFFDIAEEDETTLVRAVEKVSKGFNVEQVTKQFFQDFEGLHQKFCLEIEGIENESDRRWYASVLLNRLMFVYFLQRRYFLDQGNNEYLQDKLKICQGNNESFYDFLKYLFFEGFAKPEYERSHEIQQRLGKICYLNGGLFLRHSIEQKYPQIKVSDRAFEDVFKLFSGYSWHLNDRPDTEKDSNEVNPDVLGYIFEKYINQKEFGAYYTRPEITEYLCDRTINKLVLDRSNALGYSFVNLEEVIANLDDNLCDHLLNEILPTLTLLDPACGSGAFLVAAMKTLIAIYQQVTVKAKVFSDRSKIAKWLAEAEAHPSLEYYIKKRIITDNLYGVDIMEEATEIAKLRLFLALVASAETVEDLEPLPNIDFNIMAGNSLIGLIRVDGDAFDSLAPLAQAGRGAGGEGKSVQGNLLNALAASDYQQILEDKNKSIALYKKHGFQRQDEHLPQEIRLLQLRDHIDKLNRESQGKLNQLLLAEFSTKLGIKYEEAQLEGKPKKRLLNIADIDALEPFHWGYHFDKVFKNGGFDAIIANPPWEIFKPNSREFFLKHNDLVRKSKMDVKQFEKEQKKLLENPEIAQAWCEYQSQFPYVSSYFRSAEQYKNQISVVNGKKAGTDINLYKLFLEQCFNLLRDGGRCGIIIPTGIYTDLGTKQLREMLFNDCELENIFGISNERFIFEGVDHRFKFCLIDFEKGKSTDYFYSVFRIDPREAIKPSDLGVFLHDREQQLKISVDLVRKLSPDSLSVMEFKQSIDIEIAEKMARFPLLGEKIADKWNLKLTAEFHMTNDSHLFKTEPAEGRLPLYEGKMIHQFTHQFAEPRYWVDEKEGRQAVIGTRGTDNGQNLDYQGYRLAYRSVASSTNERSLISSILPCNVFFGHSMNACIVDQDGKVLIKSDQMLFLLSCLNSFIFDASLRSRVSQNITMFYIYQIPVPRLQKGDKWFSEIVERAAKLICTTPEFDELAVEVGLNKKVPLTKGDSGGYYGVTDEVERAKLRAELDGIIAHLYGLTEIEFQHILSTFPIVPDPVKQNALNAYRDVERGLIKSKDKV